MINWKAIIIGFVLTVIFAMILNSFIEGFGSFISIILATMIIGYFLNSSSANTAFHGALIGVIGGFLAFSILLLIGGILLIKAEYLGLVIRIIIDIVLGAFGGFLGAFIGKR